VRLARRPGPPHSGMAMVRPQLTLQGDALTLPLERAAVAALFGRLAGAVGSIVSIGAGPRDGLVVTIHGASAFLGELAQVGAPEDDLHAEALRDLAHRAGAWLWFVDHAQDTLTFVVT